MGISDLLHYLEDVEARRKGMRIWIVLVLAWSLGRSLVIADVFDKYGLNPWVYFSIDFLSSVPYAYASARSLLTFIDKQRTRSVMWAFLAATMFYLPDIYIVISSKQVPTTTYMGFGIILLALSALAVAQWKEKRR